MGFFVLILEPFGTRKTSQMAVRAGWLLIQMALIQMALDNEPGGSK
jgi:hypothetical protein